MTREEAQQLRRGDCILYLAPNCESYGTVIEANYVYFVVHWHKAYWGNHISHYGLRGDEGTVNYMHRYEVSRE